MKYFYAQYWSERAGTWLVEGDEYPEIGLADSKIKKMQASRPGMSKDMFRIACYSTPLSGENESMRLAR